MNYSKRHASTPSLFKTLEERHDSNSFLGYDYRGNLYKNTVSSYVFNDDKTAGMINTLEVLMNELLESTKNIKKTFNYTLSRNYTNFN